MKKLLNIILCLTIIPFFANATCTRADRQHENKEISRCPYHQENIYKAFAQKPGCYGELEKYRKCFFCECPISEHTTEAKKEDKGWVKKRERRVIDNSLAHG